MLISFVFQKSMQLIQDIQTFVIFTLASQINWILIIHAGLIQTANQCKSSIETFKPDINDADCRFCYGTIRKGLVFLHLANKSAARCLTEIAMNSGVIVDSTVYMDVIVSAIAYLIKHM